MPKSVMLRAVVATLVLSVALFSLLVTPGKTYAFVPCEVGQKYDVTLVSKTFHVLEEKDVIENRTSTPIPETFTVTQTGTFHIDNTSQAQADVTIEIVKIGATVGNSVGLSFQYQTGSSKTFTASPHTALHAQYGINIDHVYVDSYYQRDHCNRSNEQLQFVDVIELVGVWNVWQTDIS